MSLKEAPIIARIWHGKVKSKDAEKYYEHLIEHIIPDIEKAKVI